MPSYSVNDTYTPDNLIAGSYPQTSKPVTLASSAGALPRGAVLGQVTATGKYVLSTAAAVDGSQNVDCILAEAVDASTQEVAASAYESGEFNQDAITLGAGHTVDTVRKALRDINIYLRKVK